MMRRILPLCLLVPALTAEVVSVEITERSAVLDGKAFGKAGAYERVIGRAHFEVDPKAKANGIIHDLELAPRNKNGRVEFSADVYILKPVEVDKGSGTALLEVANRGGKGWLRFNRAAASRDPRTAEEFGDGFLLELGHTLVWVGWQFDLLASEHAVRLTAPVAKGVTGWTRSHFSPSAHGREFSVAGRGHAAYPAVHPADPESMLIVRQYQDGPGREIPRKQWRFSDPETVTLDGGFAAGKTYDVVYRAADPGIAGLGAAAIRDFISFLKFGSEDEVELGELSEDLTHAIAYGSSQSGRFLRTFLLEGFNADEQGRKVFDGVWPHVAGAARGSFTHRFAQPTRQDPYYTVEIFPFRDLPDDHPHTGVSDGILSRAEAGGVTPKVVYTLTSSEYWNRSASLMHTTIDGTANAPLPETTRIYYYAGTQHGAGRVPPGKSQSLKYSLNSNDYLPLNRAVLVALGNWVKDGREPPPSKYPSVDELAALGKLRFPHVPGLRPPGHQRRAKPLDFGPEYGEKGIIAFQPPKVAGPAYGAKLPQLDEDGNELGGVRLPSVAVPLATYGGWNRYHSSVTDVDHYPGNSGSTIPFAWSKQERLSGADSRASVEERYPSRAAYRERVTKAASSLVSQGRLLKRDLQDVVEHSLALWDHLEARYSR